MPTRWQCHCIAENILAEDKENTDPLCHSQLGKSRRWHILAIYEKTSAENNVAF